MTDTGSRGSEMSGTDLWQPREAKFTADLWVTLSVILIWQGLDLRGSSYSTQRRCSNPSLIPIEGKTTTQG